METPLETLFDDIRARPIKVSCLKQNWVDKILYAQFIQNEDGAHKFLGVSICDDGCGDKACNECVKAATEKLIKKFEEAQAARN